MKRAHHRKVHMFVRPGRHARLRAMAAGWLAAVVALVPPIDTLADEYHDFKLMTAPTWAHLIGGGLGLLLIVTQTNTRVVFAA